MGQMGSKIDIEEGQRLRAQGKSWAAVAKALGIAPSTAWNVLHAHVPASRGPHHGGRAPVEVDLTEVSRLRELGKTWREIGGSLHVATSTIKTKFIRSGTAFPKVLARSKTIEAIHEVLQSPEEGPTVDDAPPASAPSSDLEEIEAAKLKLMHATAENMIYLRTRLDGVINDRLPALEAKVQEMLTILQRLM